MWQNEATKGKYREKNEVHKHELETEYSNKWNNTENSKRGAGIQGMGSGKEKEVRFFKLTQKNNEINLAVKRKFK
jgi:hypothetical protein